MNNNKDQRDGIESPRRFWIIGAGHFGQIAVSRIRRHIPGASITVVDTVTPTDRLEGVTTVLGDGIDWLGRMLTEAAAVDRIVPAIPVHVAAEWMSLKLRSRYDIQPMAIPDHWLARMPHAMPGKPGQVFVSHADFICPDNCPEPKDRCTHTGKPRPMDLFRLLAGLELDDVLTIVLRSHQLQPGVGGLIPADMIHALDIAERSHRRPLMIATACRCHGVVDFMRLSEMPRV
ncbi:hypothetical protein DSCO28_02650 [Desulfosarcina ovata subsp. sediminis]|uniref:Potassium transporter n=1 Tax=Desulfosarcina ovata subsp. sediminis TaxID=885957 RepID=A0A5K7ZIY9_9BACT|nr:potassium transporter [Desulfosarcina ovata]BBO79699.1 hypothetical protein DSCO28_02650 [Desulfosarcina ovata subsp. sediminis]